MRRSQARPGRPQARHARLVIPNKPKTKPTVNDSDVRRFFDSFKISAAAQGPKTDAASPGMYLLAVGVGKYRIPNNDVPSTVNNAEKIAAFFKGQGGVRVAKILTNENATAKEHRTSFGAPATIQTTTIIETPFVTPGEMRRGETLVIYLSGHGDREGGDWFFLPARFRKR